MIHLNGDRERRVGLLPLASRSVQRAETAVAVRLEGTHPEGCGKRESLLITGVGCCPCQGVLMRRDLPLEPQSTGFESPYPEGTSKRERTHHEVSRLVRAAVNSQASLR